MTPPSPSKSARESESGRLSNQIRDTGSAIGNPRQPGETSRAGSHEPTCDLWEDIAGVMRCKAHHSVTTDPCLFAALRMADDTIARLRAEKEEAVHLIERVCKDCLRISGQDHHPASSCVFCDFLRAAKKEEK